jgi:DNA invertase Pin-like site-specific DNA recombinase
MREKPSAEHDRPVSDTAVYVRADEDGSGLTATYGRISEDRNRGAGVRDQLHDCMALAHAKGWTRLVSFEDNDISASKYSRRRREDYQRLLAMVRAGQIRRIVVAHMDRLYRTMKELEELIELTESGRLEIVSVYSGPLDLSTSDGRAAARILVAIATKASDDTSRRVRRAQQRARDAGESTGGSRPFGWQRMTVTEPDGTTRETWDPMTPDPDEAAAIQAAAKAVIEGASLSDIARQWNADGIKQPHAARDAAGTPRWTAGQVRTVLTSPRHAGLVPYYREVTDDDGKRRTVVEIAGPAKWPAIIDRPAWERCREVLDSRAPQWAQPRRRSLLTGLVRCGYCGASMTRDVRGGAGKPSVKVWKCTGRPGTAGADGQQGCGRVSIQAEELERYVTEITFRMADEADVTSLVAKKAADNKEYARLARALADNKRQYDEAAASAGRRSKGGRGLSVRAYEQLTANLEAEERDLQRRLAEIGDTSIMLRYAGRRGALRAAWESERISQDEQRAAIKETIGTVTILPYGPGHRDVSERAIATPDDYTPIRMRHSAPAA